MILSLYIIIAGRN